ncbi:MAG: hypothetical protein ABI995_15975 [Acidobacteriota bacterium]
MDHEQELEMLTQELQRDGAIRVEDIRPSMSEADRQRALDEILRVLLGQE